MLRVTIDTNVLVSATYWTGDSHKILRLVEQGALRCVLCAYILDEYARVLSRDEIKRKVEKKRLMKLIAGVADMCELVRPIYVLDVVAADPADNEVLACAAFAEVDYLITNDAHLLDIKRFGSVRIITPAQFLKIVAKT